MEDDAGGGRLNSLDHCSSDGPAGARQGPQRTDHPLVESGGHTREEPSGERKHEGRESEKEGGTRRGGGCSERHGEVSTTAWSVQWASCPLFFHLWALCQIQSTWLSSLGNHLTALSLSLSLSPSHFL